MENLIKEKELDIDKKGEEINASYKDMNEKENKLLEQKKQIQTITSEIEKNKKILNDISSNIETLNTDLKTIKSQKIDNDKNLEEMSTELKTLQQNIDETTIEIEQLTKTINEHQIKKTEIQNNIEKLAADERSQSEERARLSIEIEKYTKEYQKLDITIKQVRLQKEQCKDKQSDAMGILRKNPSTKSERESQIFMGKLLKDLQQNTIKENNFLPKTANDIVNKFNEENVTYDSWNKYKTNKDTITDRLKISGIINKIWEKSKENSNEEMPQDIETESINKEIDRIMALKNISLEFSVCIGVTNKFYDSLGIEKINLLEKNCGVKILKLNTTDKYEIIEELSNKTKDSQNITALFDCADNIKEGELEELFTNFAVQAKKNILWLMYPEISAINKEKIHAIETTTEMKGILEILVSLLPENRSYMLSGKSLYEIRAERIYNTHCVPYSSTLTDYLAAKMEQNRDEKYVITAVDNAFDLKMLREAIRERREIMEISLEDEDPIKDFVVLRNELLGNSIEDILEATGLGAYLNKDRIIVIKNNEQLTISELKNILNLRIDRPTISNQNIIIGTKEDIISPEQEELNMFSINDSHSMIMLTMDSGLASQMYSMLLEILANNRDAKKAVINKQEIEQKQDSGKKYNIYKYFPKIKLANYEQERKNYERYIHEVLVKA
ncbi:hypothetical protein OMAG_002082 [Candidatus Omnitrophus magneticus]|uniref:Uncharacterized protein n=1 Tax=Candidatus Omnitrophus magneticus TaxID=1609969 RepID=A0A0F0CL65_9BACT|nr:hypothetical protein OMAG_002082 [Candidatus Omnitrophus magneticus]